MQFNTVVRALEPPQVLYESTRRITRPNSQLLQLLQLMQLRVQNVKTLALARHKCFAAVAEDALQLGTPAVFCAVPACCAAPCSWRPASISSPSSDIGLILDTAELDTSCELLLLCIDTISNSVTTTGSRRELL